MITGGYLARRIAEHVRETAVWIRPVEDPSPEEPTTARLGNLEISLEVGAKINLNVKGKGSPGYYRPLTVIVSGDNSASFGDYIESIVKQEFWDELHVHARELRNKGRKYVQNLRLRNGKAVGTYVFTARITTQNNDTAFHSVYNQIIRPIVARRTI